MDISAIDPTMNSTSHHKYDGYTLTRMEMTYFWTSFLGELTPERTAAASLLDRNLENLPPTLVIVPEYDILRDEGLRLAATLASAGVDASATVYDGLVHGFLRRYSLFDAANRATAQIATFLQTTLSPESLDGARS